MIGEGNQGFCVLGRGFMNVTVDAIGEVCPVPVIKAKKAFDQMQEGVLEILVDNETSVSNLESFARSRNVSSSVKEVSEGVFSVSLIKDTLATSCEDAGDKAVVVISSSTMGSGSEELGEILMKSFVFALTQLDELPQAVLLYNSGVHLAVEGSPVLEDIKTLEQGGVEVLVCGTCLDYYGLKDDLMVGRISNMYTIIENQLHADKILCP